MCLRLWFLDVETNSGPRHPACQTKDSQPLCNFRCTLLLQLHFNSVLDAYLAPIELVLCIMEKIVLSPICSDFIRDKMSIIEGVKCSCSNRVVLKIT